MTSRADEAPRWVVAHCGARDQYQLPIALHESSQLHRFVTDWYSPMDRRMLRALLPCAPQVIRSSLACRYRKELPSALARDLKLMGLLKAVIGTDTLNFNLNRLVGECAARLASNSGSHLLITSYYGWAAFPQLPQHTRKVLFQIHPHPSFLRDLYRASESEEGDNFESESEMRVGEGFLKSWGQESLDADVVIAASNFTRQSLLYAGVRPEKIRVVPYGVDSLVFRDDVATPSGKPRLLFVGQSTCRKGFQNLLRAWERIGNQGAELHIVSRVVASRREVQSGGPVVWHGRLGLRDLVALMNSCDLLVLPSIAEGYGHVLLQSLSCGTPILCSDATAGPDLLTGWEDGFIFPSGNWNQLCARLDFWLTNVGRLRQLRRSARKLAESLPWERFRQGIRNVCDEACYPAHDFREGTKCLEGV